MAREQATVMGSGSIPYLNPILHTSLGGTATELPVGPGPGQGRGVRTGTQVTLSNPEDLNSVPAFVASGISVGLSAVEIWSPDLHESLLRRRRTIKIQNLGPAELWIGHNTGVGSGLANPGWKVNAPDAGGVVTNEPTTLELPLMGGVSVWGIAVGVADVRVIVY